MARVVCCPVITLDYYLFHDQGNIALTYRSGHEDVTVLFPGFAIN